MVFVFKKRGFKREDSNLCLISLENYNLISKGKRCSAHGGLAIYLHEKYNKTVPSPIISELFEGQFIKISEADTAIHILLGNTYTPPRDLLYI